MANSQHAPIDSPVFTGEPLAPTPGVNDSSSRLATTAYVKANIPRPVDYPPITLSGDVGGRGTSSITATVLGLRGHPLALDPPGDTDVLQWREAAWAWSPVKACEIGAQAGGAAGQIQVSDGTGQFIGITVSGDASINGSTGVATVLGLRGRPISPTAPTNGQSLVYLNGQWQPGGGGGGPPGSPGGGIGSVQYNAGGGAFGGVFMSGDATWSTGTGLLTLANANAGGNTVSGITFNQKGLVTAAAQPPYLTANQSIALTGDVTGSGASSITATVIRLQNRAVAATAPGDGQALVWNQTGQTWEPVTLTPGTGGALPGGTTGQVQTNAGGGAFGAVPTMSGDATWNTTSGVLTLNPAVNTSGAGTYNGITVNPKGLVTSAVDNAYLTSSAAATIYAPLLSPNFSGDPRVTPGPGLADNDTSIATTAFVKGQGYIQSIGLSGDLSGSGTSSIAATVIGLRNRAISTTAPLDGQMLAWNAAAGGGSGEWQPTPPPTGGTGTGAPPGGATGYVQINAGGGNFGGVFMSGDATWDTSSGALTIGAQRVSYAKIQQVAGTQRLLGNPGAGPAAISEISLGTGLSFAGNVLNAAAGTGIGTVNAGTAGQIAGYASSTNAVSGVTVTGDISLNGANGVSSIGAGRVTLAMHAPMTAQRLFGNPTTGSAVPSEIIVGTGLSFSGGNTLNATGGTGSGVVGNGTQFQAAWYDGAGTTTTVHGNPNVTFTTAGNVTINRSGLAMPASPGLLTPILWSVGAASENVSILLDAIQAGANITMRRTGSTPTSPVNSGDGIGTIAVRGYGTSGYGTAATGRITFGARQTFTDANMGTDIQFWSTPLNSAAAAMRAIISDGLVVGNPILGDRGAGSINAEYIYINGNAVGTASATVNPGTGPQIAQYPAGTSSVVGGVTMSGDATIAAGGAVTLANSAGTRTNLGLGTAATPTWSAATLAAATAMLNINRNTGALPPAIAGTALWINSADGDLGNTQLLDAYAAGPNLSFRRANGSGSGTGRTAIALNDVLGSISSRGAYDANNYSASGTARIFFRALENFSSSAQGTAIWIDSNTATTTTLNTRMVISPGVQIYGTGNTPPTGGDMGAGSLNAQALYVQGTAVLTSGATYMPIAGGTFTGKVTTLLSGTGGAGFNLPHGAAPTSPVAGDIWTTTAGLYARIQTTTVGPFSAGGTTNPGGSVNQVQWNNTTFSGSAGATFDVSSLKSMNIALGSDATGDIYYRNASGNLTRLGATTSGFLLQTNGAGTAPSWTAPPSGGGVITSTAGQIPYYSSTTQVTGATGTVLTSAGVMTLNQSGAAAPAQTVGTVLQLVGAATPAIAGLQIDALGNNTTIVLRRADAGALAGGANIGLISARGHDGSAYSAGVAGVQFSAAETWDNTKHGSRVDILTMPLGSIAAQQVQATFGPSGVFIGAPTAQASPTIGDLNAVRLFENGARIGPDTTATVAAAGTTQAGATALTAAVFNNVTTGSGGVALPTGSAGLQRKIRNSLATTISVYPANDGNNATINTGAANAPITILPNSTGYFEAMSTTQWFTVP